MPTKSVLRLLPINLSDFDFKCWGKICKDILLFVCVVSCAETVKKMFSCLELIKKSSQEICLLLRVQTVQTSGDVG